MSKHALRRARGLSLVELLLGLAITALVMAPLVPILETASNAARSAGDQVALERDADFALERIAARIRATAPAPDVQNKPVDEWLKPVVYSLILNPGDSAGVLVEQQGKETYVLTEPKSVTDLTLTMPATEAAQPAIRVSLSMKRGAASTTAVATVRMGTAR